MIATNDTLAKKGVLLRVGSVADTTLIAATSPTKDKDGGLDPERHPTKKSSAWHFAIKTHIDVDADSGLVCSVIGTAADLVTQGDDRLHGKETVVFADARHQGAGRMPQVHNTGVRWQVAVRPSKRHAQKNMP